MFSDTVSFYLTAPAGWVLDCNTGRNDGPLTVAYRKGESWRTGVAVMYASILADGDPNAYRARIDGEVANWKQRVPDAVVTSLPSLRTSDGLTIELRQFVSNARGLQEIVAYIPRGRSIPLLVMTARTMNAFEEALADYRTFVQSYAPGPVVKRP